MTVTSTAILFTILTAVIGFLFGLVRLGINRLIKGQDQSKKDAEDRVNGLRSDIKEMTKDIKDHGTRLTKIETRCNMEHGE